MGCPRIDGARIRVRDPDTGATATPACKSWRCDFCRRGLSHHLADTIERYSKRWMLWTVTLPGGSRRPSPDASWRYLQRTWVRMRHRIDRRYGSVRWVLVKEAHRDGVAHGHVLMDRYVPHRWFRRAWAECGGGYIDLKYGVGKPARYVAKYLSKAGGDVPSGVRRYSSPRKSGVTAYRPPAGWLLEAPVHVIDARGYACLWVRVEGDDATMAWAAATHGDRGPPDADRVWYVRRTSFVMGRQSQITGRP